MRHGTVAFAALLAALPASAQEAPVPALIEAPAPAFQYSKQRIVHLDAGEACVFPLRDGSRRVIRLKSAAEARDGVVRLVRRADVEVEIDGATVRLACGPYVMPTEVAGIRLLVDTTSAWASLPKRVQLSLWDGADPVVDPALFGFPLRGYRLLSHGLQAYNEPVHLGLGDGDPEGGRFYHDYGFDLAGAEGRERVIAAAAGRVVRLLPPEAPYGVAIQDDRGLVWEYSHLDSIHPAVKPGLLVAKGQELGILGRKGPSGNFAHLHLGSYDSLAALDRAENNRRHNLWPWLVHAYEAQTGQGLYAVARPHVLASTGEKVRLDGSRSLCFGGRIVAWRWRLHDGAEAAGAVVEAAYDRPGVYMEMLEVEDDRGRRDADFCKVKVFTAAAPEPAMPTIFMTHTPTLGLAAGRPVLFRCWLQAREPGTFALDFGDGQVVAPCASYQEVIHAFGSAGLHVVTATAVVGGVAVAQKQMVVVR